MNKNLFIVKKSNQVVQNIELVKGKTVKLFTEFDSQYQLLNKQGKVNKKPKTKKVDDDLWIFDEENLTNTPDVILEDYYSYFPIENVQILTDFNATFATPPYSQQMATALPTTPTPIPAPVGIEKVLASFLGISNIAIMNERDNFDRSYPTSSTNQPLTAEISINPIDNINQAKAGEMLNLSGNLTLSNNVVNSEVVISINGENFPANVQGNTWSLAVDGNKLAYQQGEASIVATVKVADKDGNENQSANTANYQVDTVIETPVISFNQIAGDDVINFNEAKQQSQTISGKVSNVNDNDELVLTIGTKTYPVKVINGEFSTSVPTDVLTASRAISATISTTDAFGNTAKASANHPYQVDLTELSASISINPIDNINQAKAGEMLNLSGNLTLSNNVVNSEVVISINGENFPANVQGNTWSLAVDGNKLAYQQGEASIVATVKVADKDGNENQSANTANYQVDTVIETPVISFNQIAGDDVINFNEAKQQSQTISGKVSNVNDNDELVLTIGTKTYPVKVINGEFSTSVPTDVLTASRAISATISTTDAFGNTAKASANHPYQVDLTELSASISINPIDNINQAKAGEMLNLSGNLTLSNNVVNSEVVISINGENFPANVQGNTWSLAVDGNKLAYQQGEASIVATVKVADKDGNENQSANTANYQVDTVIETPVISFNQIAGDDVINFNEAKQQSQTISGKVSNVNDNDELVLTIGTKTYPVKVINGEFSTSVPTDVLTASRAISATISTTDAFGNTAKASANHPYQVDLTELSASISINPIDNINQAKAGEMLNLSGNLTLSNNVVNSEVVISINGENFPANVQGNTWSLAVDGNKLAYQQGEASIVATVKVADKDGNENQSANTANYQVDTVIETPVISFNQIAGDDVINFNEAKQQSQTISGKVSNVNDNDELVLTIGTKTYPVKVINGEFSTSVPTDVLTASRAISATISTTDAFGNTAKASANHPYQVDLTELSASISINPIDNINQAKAGEMLNLSGNLTLSNNVVNSEVVISINGENFPANVQGNTWSLAVDGNKLAYQQGEASIVATVKVADKDGNENQSANTANYQVDTVIETPVISFNQIAGDDVINFNEAKQQSQTISGKVSNVNDNDELVLTIGTKTYPVKVINGEFSTSVPTDVLTASRAISATISTTDAFGNTAKASANHPYQVDLTELSASISINPIDNINQAKAGEMLNLSGNLTLSNNVVNSEVVISINGENFPANVQGNTWSLAVDGNKLAYQQGEASIVATVKVADKDGNENQSANTANYQVDTVIETPVISFNQIAGDDVINFNEAKQQSQTISGKVSNVNDNDELVLTIGTKTYPVKVINGEFSTSVPTDVLTASRAISATISTTDAFGNTAKASANHPYQVDLTELSASISINPIDNINQAKAGEMLNLSGNLTLSNNVVNSEVVISINGENFPANVQGNTWSLAVDGNKLAYQQGEASIVATVKVADKDGNENQSANTANYQVDTVIETPVISFNQIAGDDVINFNEAKQQSQTISGKVSNVNDNDELVLTIGTKTYPVKVINGEFSTSVPTDVLTASRAISATISTTDAFGNTAKASANHPYQVDLTELSASISINPIDNINQAKAGEMLNLSGNLTLSNNVVNSEVVISINGENFPANVQGNTWSLAVDGNKLAYQQGEASIVATVKVADKDGNENQSANTANYQVDTVIETPVISFNQIAGDDVINFNEAKQQSQTISGKVSNVNDNDELVLTIGTKTYPVKVINGEFSTSVPTDVLTASRAISATISTTDAFGNTAKASANHPYQVDLTELSASISINPIDNINQAKAGEMLNLSGNLTLSNNVVNSEVVISINGENFPANVQGNTWSLAVDGNKLAYQQGEASIVATVKVADKDGNENQSANTANYQVDTVIETPVISFNQIAGDDVINFNEAKQQSQTISGKVSNVNDNDELVLTIGTKTYPVKVINGEFSTSVPTDVLTASRAISATISTTDAFGNTAKASANHPYQVDLTELSASISINPIDNINQAKAGEMLNLSGNLTLSNNVVNSEVVISINGENFPANVQGNTWSLAVDGNKLAYQQGEASIVATVKVADKDGNENQSANTANYQVDTVIETPVISFNQIAGDDVINFNEAKQQSQTISGKVSNVNDNDELVLTIGTKTYPVKVINGEFSTSVPTDVLTASRAISATISTTDAFGNTAKASANHPYQVDLTELSASISINPIDNINQAKAGEMLNLSGNLTLSNNVVNSEVVISINGENFPANVQGNTWSLAVDGNKLAYQQGEASIVATVKVADKDGNENQSANTANYQVDTVIETPVISFNQIAGDDVINFNEAKQQSQTISGKVSNVNDNDELVLTIGTKTYPVKVINGEFSTSVPTDVLTASRAISATISTTDAFGNTAKASANHPYQVDLTELSASISINPIDNINQAKAGEMLNLSGNLTLSNNVVNSEVVISINGENFPANVQGNTWSLAVDGNKLAYQQGEASIVATVKVADKDGNENQSANTANYQVDTVIETPVISFNQIAGDDVINFNEAKQQSQTISGKVSNVNDNDELVLTIGTKTYPVKVINGEFSTSVPTDVLTASRAISATISTTDAFGNTAKASANHPYQVDLTELSASISINPIDNINQAKAGEMLNLSGNLTLSNNVVNSEVVISINGENFPANVQGNTWSLAVDGNKLAYQQGEASIVATVKVADKDGNENQSANTANYQVDTVIETPVISFNQIAGDDVINFNEAKQQSQTISGKVSNVNDNDELVLTIGTKTYPVKVINGEFSTSVPTDVLTASRAISATISTTDAFGNTAKASANHPYQVDLTELSASISINPIDNINQAKAGEMLNLSGNLTLSNNVVNSEVVISINGENFPANVQGNTWSLAVDGNKLAYQQGEASIVATVKVADKDGNENQSANTANYQVDTVIETPVISFNQIAGDDVINFNEAKQQSQTISGKVSNVNDNDELVLTIGTKTYPVKVINGEFSTSVPTDVLTASRAISATISTTDAFGNTAKASANHPYQVDLTELSASISINPIDNINQAKAGEMLNLSGNLTLSNNVVNSEVVISINGENFPANVQGNTWSLAVDGNKLAYQQGEASIVATVKVADKDGNENQSANTANYQVDTVIETPVISFNQIAGDDVINFNEAKQQSQTISGKVSHVNDNDELVLTIGAETYPVKVVNGEFSTSVPTDVLTASRAISATISTTDAFGNTAKASANHPYQVDLTELSASISINPIDNINQAKAGEMLNLSGNLTLSNNVVNSEVVISINGENFPANVQGNTWSLAVDGNKLAYQQGEASIVATVKVADKDGNISENSKTTTYLVDTIIERPEITFDQIAQDDIINIIESEQAETPITGKVKNANNGDIITLKIGLAEFKGEVQNGEFNIPVNTLTLMTHKEVVASITTTDDFGNSETGTNSRTISVDDTPPEKPIISINDITKDNIVNAEEAKSNILISGTVQNVAVGKTIIVSCACTSCGTVKWIDFRTVVRDGGVFEIDFKGEDVANADTIKVTASNEDNAGNTNSAEELKTYIVDTKAPEATLEMADVTDGNTINLQESQKAKTTLSGTFGNLQADETIKSLKLTVNNVDYQADITDNRYTADIDTSNLVANTLVTATAIVVDKAGNEQTLVVEKPYKVDIDAPVATVEILSIAENDVINLDETGTQVNIKGKVSGEFKVGDTVKISIDDKEHDVKLTDTTGNFSLSVSADMLKDINTKVVVARFETTDEAGNRSQIATADKAYTVEIPPADIQVEISKISGDNFINETEVLGEVRVTGVVTGNDRLTTGQTVELSLNGKVLKTVTANADGNFDTTVNARELANSAGHTLTAKVVGRNNAMNTGSLKYSVDEDVSAQINITKVVDNTTSVNVGDGVGMVYIDGVASFGNIIGRPELGALHSEARNAKLVRTVEVKIGENTYSAGVKDGKFRLEIPESELKKLDGEALRYTFKAEPWGFRNGEVTGLLNPEGRGFITVETTSLEISSPHIVKENGKDTVKVAEKTSTISGMVSGVAKAEDVITLEINGKIYSTKVTENKTFSVEVANVDLQNHQPKAIVAILETTDLSGQKITVSDYEFYTTSAQTAQAFVSGHTQETEPDEYFVNLLGNTTQKYGQAYDFGIYGVPVGGDQTRVATIKYYFNTKADWDSYSQEKQEDLIGGDAGRQIAHVDTIKPFSDTLKNIIRNAYKQISSYVNVEFVETDNPNEADTNLFYADFNPGEASAFAFANGSLWWDAVPEVNEESFVHNSYTALHEITHNLQMTHTHEGFTGNQKMEDSSEFSYMSYRSYVNNFGFQDLLNLRMYDLAFLHYQLGVNKKARSGNDVYSFKEYNMYKDDGDRYIWDGDGVDTFDASTAEAGVHVDLTPGSWIYVDKQSELFAIESQTVHRQQIPGLDDALFNQAYIGGFTENTYTKGQAFIGYGTQIENLMGSAHKDTLIGNDADNHISGGAGDDTIRGGLGNDYLDGGEGIDTLIGGEGNDIYVVDNEKDVIIENTKQERNGRFVQTVQEGEDLVYSTVNYTLSNNVENITLLGSIAKEATGNALDNTMIANNAGVTLRGLEGNDMLIGGLGEDRLEGGAGNDIYVFNTDFNGTIDTLVMDNNDTIHLDSNIFTALTKGNNANIANFIKYDSQTGILSYDEDNTGEIDPIAFAKIEGQFTFTLDKFTVI